MKFHPSNYQLFFQINDLIIYLKGLDGKATDLLEPVRFTTANIIASILVNETYRWGDPEQLQVPVTLALADLGGRFGQIIGRRPHIGGWRSPPPREILDPPPLGLHVKISGSESFTRWLVSLVSPLSRSLSRPCLAPCLTPCLAPCLTPCLAPCLTPCLAPYLGFSVPTTILQFKVPITM